MHLFFVSSRLHWRERGLFTTPALTSAKGLTLLCSSVLMLWVSHFFLSFCLPFSLALITFACLEDSCPGWNLSWHCKLAAQLFPSKPTILPHRSLDSKFVCSTKSSRMFASVLILASPSERATGCWLTGTSPTLWQHNNYVLDWIACQFVLFHCIHSSIPPRTQWLLWNAMTAWAMPALGIYTLPVPGTLMEGLWSGQIYCFVKGTGAIYNVGQCTILINPPCKWLPSFWALYRALYFFLQIF